VDELLFGVGGGVDLGEGAELGVGAEDEVDAGGCPLGFPDLRSIPSNRPSVAEGFHSVDMSSRLTKKSLVSVPGLTVRTPSFESL
jgi:hypothetical protein